MSDFTNSFFRRNNDSYGYAKQDYDTFKKNYDSFDFDAYLKQQREERERQEELRRLQEEQEKNSGFFKGGDSNFFVGALNSYLDFSADIGQGFFRTLEGVADFLQYGVSDTADMWSNLGKSVLGENNIFSDITGGYRDFLRENAKFDSTGSLFGTNENAQETLFGNQWREDINKASYLGDMADSIGEGIGNIGAMAAMSAVGGAGLGAAGVGVTETGALTTGGKLLLSGGNSYMSAYGNSRSEAYKNGATDSEAQKYAFVNGLAEAISEQVFDSMPGIKSAGFADKIGIKDALANKIKSGLGTNAGKVFLKLTGGFEEGAEEMISNALVAVGQDIIHSIDQNYNYNMENQTGNILEDFKNSLVSEDSIKSFMSAGLTSVILGVGGDTLTTAQRNQVINAFAKDNNMSFKEAKQLLGGETLNQAQEQVQREIKRDNAEISNNIELEEAAKNRIVNYMKQSNRENIESGIETLVKEEARKAGIELNEEQLKSETEKIRNRYIDEVNNPELYRTFSQKTDNEKDAALAKSFEEAKLNDSKETHKIYNTLKTLQDNNENSNYKVVSNEKLVDMGILEKNDKGEYVLPDGTKATINGFKQGDTIYINADGLNPYESTIGHEIGEAIKSSDSEAYSELKTMVKDLFNPSEKELQAYSKLYNGNTDSIEDEYVNDKLGELFKNDKLIDKIADNKTILQKFIDEIKRLVKYKFSNQEQRQLMDLQKKLEDKYVELYKQADFKSEVDESLPFYEEEKPKFSLQEDLEKYVYPQVYENYKYEDKSKITKSIEELEEYKKTLDTDTDEGWEKNFKANAQIRALEAGFDNEYDYYVDQEKTRLRADAERGVGMAARLIEEGKQNDQKNNQLQEDIANATPKQNEQFEIIQKTNPAPNDQLVWIRSPLDIKTFEQVVNEEDGFSWGDYSLEDAKKDLKRNKVRVYSSYAIKDGTFVSTSYQQALDYAGGDPSNVHSREINPDNVAWISGDEGQYANTKRTRYSLSVAESNTGLDNSGNKLSQGQQEYFKDSVATNEEGDLIQVFHTTTDEIPQFNEFNPVGTPYYRFGDQVVNYYTDDKDMSGSYASQDYQMADTKRLTSIDEAREYLNKVSEETGNKFTLYQREDGKWLLSQDKQISKEARDFLNSLTDEEKQQMKNNIFIDTEDIGSNYERSFMWDKFDKELQQKYNAVLDKYMGTADLVAIQQEMMKYLDIPDSLRFETEEYGNGIGFYETEDELFRNIKHDIQDTNWSKNSKLQYQGYVNITNPYIVDAEERNWNQVVTQSNDFIDELDERVDQETKDRLTRLYNESANKSAELREKQAVYSDALYDVGAASSLNVDDDIRKMSRVLNRVDNAELKAYLETGEPGHKTSFYSSLANALVNEEIIDYDMEDSIRENWVLPDDVRQWLVENYNKQFKTSDINANNVTQMISVIGRTTSLKELADNRDEAYREYDKYRYPQSYFIEQLQEGNEDIGYELDDMLETRAEIMGADAVAEEIAQAASVGFSKPELIKLWGTSKTTNDIVKEIIASNKDGSTNYDGVIIKNVYDYGGKAGVGGTSPHDLYVTFNSNQFKAIDNYNPTEDTDIRYQLAEQTDERTNNLLKVVESYDDYLRTLPSYQQLQERQSTEETNLPYTDDTHGILTKADYKNKKIELFDKKIDAVSNRMEEQAKRFARQNLELSNKNKQELTELLQEYTGLTREGIFNSDAREKIKEFVKDHSKQEFVEEIVNEDIRDLQKAIRNTQFIVDKDSAGEFADGITAFKKNNPGIKIKYGKSNIDSVYQELAETYPGMLETDVNDKDIPFILADFLKKPYRQFNNKNVQVFQLSDEEIDNVANKIYYGLTNNAISDDELQNIANEISEKVEDKYARQMASEKYREEAREAIDQIGIENIKDKKRGIQYKINTMKRNLRDIMDRDSAQLMYDKYFKPITIHNAQSEVDKQSYVERIQKYGLTNDESVYTQMLGEQKYNPESDVTQAQLDEYASKHNIDKQKCTEAVEEFRNIYDELIVRVNESLKANGYKPIEYRQGYFPHFIEDKPTSIIGKLADKLGWHIQKGTLPTDIAGITEGFKPGKTWTSFSQQRTGDATDYNALKGMDNYLRGAMDLIYHTEDIQRLRALENELRYQYSEKGMQEKIDAIYANDELSPEEKAQEISLLVDNQKNNPLGNFVTELRDYTNSLANKKSILDRGMEQSLGRDWYSIMNNINGRVSANMVGANISSAMTNFIPLTQAWSQVSTKNLMRGMYESIKNTIKNDGFDQNSVYLTNRTQQADTLYKTLGGKINEKLGIPFEAVDSFTSNAIVRAKYYENLEKGMSEQEAISNADEFAKDVMAGRSKGDQPTIFNTKNPIYKLFTAFQLEVNNQYGYMFKDIPADLAGEAKDKLAAAFVKMFLGAWIYNFITEKLTGRKAAFSPIDMAIDEYKTATNENLDFAGKVEAIAKDIAEETPFVGGMMGGGRLPIQAAIPYDNPLSMITSTIQDIGGAFDSDESKKNTAINNLKKEWLKPVYYLGLPFAGGQIKKTNEGLAMYNENLPTPGSYTSSGKLRFEADTSPLGRLQAAVFGQYASENAREYFDKGYSPLSEKQVNEAMDANLPIAEYREVNKGIAKAKKTAKENGESQSEAQYDYIYNLPISMEQKNSLINSKLGTSENVTDDNGFIKYTDGSKTYWYDSQNDIVYNSKYREMSNIDVDDLTKYSNKKDLTNYGDYGSLEEFNYANNNPTKYKVIQQITDYNSFKKYKDDLTAIKDNYNDGTKAGQNKAKQEVFNYINGLELNVIQKLILQKMAGGYSINNYKSQIRNYIQNLNMTAEEKKELDDELF